MQKYIIDYKTKEIIECDNLMEWADGAINGDFCQECGEFIGEGDGYPRTCENCNKEV